MREFIDDKGFYLINIPESWVYYLRDSKVHSFNDINGAGVFQISFNEKTKQGEKNRNNLMRMGTATKFGDLSLSKISGPRDDKLNIDIWIGEIDKYFITITFTYDKEPKDKDKLVDELNILPDTISSIKLIPESDRNKTLVSYRLRQFLKGIAATNDLLNNAVGHKSFIEAVIIIANRIDALLRTGLILKQQLIQNNSVIELKFLYQGNTDSVIMEKEVYKQAMELKIIDNQLYDSLIGLYGERNKVVHRYIISDITTAQIDNIARRYFRVSEKVRDAIVRLEDEQIQKGIGMTVKGPPKNNTEIDETMKSWLAEKHGGIAFDE